MLELIVRELVRVLGAEIALLGVSDRSQASVEVLAAWDAVSGRESLPCGLRARDGFMGQALGFERARIEPIDLEDDSFGTRLSVRVTHGVGVALRPPGHRPGVLWAGFSGGPPLEVAGTLWVADSYAGLASLYLHDREAFGVLLGVGRADGLTGCLTQVAFVGELAREIHRSARHGLSLSCCFVDVDRFKRVNDRYGHLHGSRVLTTIATVLREAIRSEDTLGCYGGDEFVLLLPDTDEAAAAELGERLRARINTTMINVPDDPIDISIGVAQWDPGSPADVLLAAADQALLDAKAAGGGTVISASVRTSLTARGDSGERAPTRDAPVIADQPQAVSVTDVLHVLAHFDQFGGASVELTAWELDADLTLVASAWSRAISKGLLDPAGTDRGSGETMWRLSDKGHRASETAEHIP